MVSISAAARTPSSEITDERIYLRRREFLRMAGAAALSIAAGRGAVRLRQSWRRPTAARRRSPASSRTSSPPTRPLNTFEEITTYNNFYEFGTGKDDPAALRRHR